MRRIAFMVLMALAVMSFAQETVGGWLIYHKEATLLDPASTLAFWEGSDGALLVVMLAPEARVMVAFPDYLASENERHDETVLFVTDLTAPRSLPGGWRPGVKSVRWSGSAAQAILDDILRASEMIFRTYDYRGNEVDAVFYGLDPKGTALMIAALRQKGE